jgi:hypothetical protein
LHNKVGLVLDIDVAPSLLVPFDTGAGFKLRETNLKSWKWRNQIWVKLLI